MQASDSPIEARPLRHCTLGDFLDLLASDAMLPGAGAAGGVALALAAACAGKAVAITRRHADGDPALQPVQDQLAHMMHKAIVLGQQDAIHFKQQLTAADPDAADTLLRIDGVILDLCRTLERLLDDYEDAIAPTMSGDWHAARALLRACRVIHKENVHELTTGETTRQP